MNSNEIIEGLKAIALKDEEYEYFPQKIAYTNLDDVLLGISNDELIKKKRWTYKERKQIDKMIENYYL